MKRQWNEAEYRRALDGLRFSDAGKERIMKNLMKQEGPPAKARRVKPIRAALLAACLCLALLGTAAAAQYFGVRIGVGNGADDTDVWMEGGVAYYPVEQLSDELRALENEHRFLAFNSWQDAEEFIGVELMDNPVLDASPAKGLIITYTDGEDQRVSGRFILATSVGLDHVRLDGCYRMGRVDIRVEGFLFTDRMEEKCGDWNERYYGLGFVEGQEPVMKIETPYTAPSGLEAQLVTFERGYWQECLAAFSLNGRPFIVRAWSDDIEESREALYQVLDGFVLD